MCDVEHQFRYQNYGMLLWFFMTLVCVIKFTRHLQQCHNWFHFLHFGLSQHCKTDGW